MDYKSFFESPDISLTGKTAHVNNVSLRDIPVEDVEENIVFFRHGQDGGFFPLGFTLIYFMDSAESAKKLSKNPDGNLSQRRKSNNGCLKKEISETRDGTYSWFDGRNYNRRNYFY